MVVGVAGLGLIGGSFAKHYKAAGCTVCAFDINPESLKMAMDEGVVDKKLDKSTVSECDVVILAVYPQACIDFLKDMAEYIRKDTVVLDTGGVKRIICEECFKIADEYGFTFAGGHPMAGTQFSGYSRSKDTLFTNAPLVIVPSPDKFGDEELYEKIKKAVEPVGFGTITFTTAENHDAIIAFTSQLAHVVSNAYVKSPTAKEHFGFSAGSYRDLTRVAWLNEKMWTELFLANGDYLANEIGYIIGFLGEYKTAIEAKDAEKLESLLREGRIAKEQIDG